MSSLGVLFAVDEFIVGKIKAMKMEERPEYISEDLEDLYFDDYPEKTYELDKMWDPIHRILTDGTLVFDNSKYPLNDMILGGDLLYFDGEEYDDYIIVAKSPKVVAKVSEELEKITEKKFIEMFKKAKANVGDELSDDDLEEAWMNVEDSMAFFKNAVKHNLWVLFTVDQ